MKAKVLVIGAVLAALALLMSRMSQQPAAAPIAPAASVKTAPPDLRQHPSLASYRVFEEPAVDGRLPYRGANYTAQVSPDGLRFEAGGHRISLRTRRIEQGEAALDLSSGTAASTRFAAAKVDRGQGVTEEFVFENRRAEHLVHLDRPVGEGAVTVRVAVESNLTGPVQQVRRGDLSWKDMTLVDGGLVFTDAEGKPALAYHGAVAIDAKGRRQEFDPRWENGEICLEVPAAFLKDAAYPVVIDPWLELDFSGSGGGISKTGTVSETPAIALISGGSPCVAWSDASDGDFDIYFRYWNGSSWTALGTSAQSGGISANSGISTNPSIGFATPTDTSFFHPFIAWEDDTSGTTNIYAKIWTGADWAALGNSADGGGVSLSIGVPCRNPQAVGVLGLVDNDPLATQPDRSETFPCIVWEREAVGIQCRFFYPGDNRIQAPEADWYAHPSGGFVTVDASAARPSAAVDSTNRLVVTWEASTGTQYDIFVARSTSAGQYSVDSGTPTPQPVGVWGVIGGNVCAGLPVALSIQPSLALDSADNMWVAWQETVGVEREIYVRTSGGGAWAGVAGSSAAGGISGTSVLGATTTSSFPSIAVNPSSGVIRPVVAWEDNAGANPEIYVRRLNAAGAAWDQVADEGSSMLVAPEVLGNNAGISRTPSFSLRPKAVAALDGTISVAWRDGSSGSFDLYLRRYHDNSPTNLLQQTVDGLILAPLLQGETSRFTTLQFSAVITAESATLPTLLRLQVEIRPNSTPFTGQVTHESLEVASGGTATILFTGLPNVNYHWRARSIDANAGRTSPWVPFGTNADGATDFRVDSNAVGAGPTNTQADPQEKKDKCGLLGLEVLAVLGLAAFARRRRAARA